MSTTTPPDILFTAAEVAKFSDVEQSTLRSYEPEGFGSPGHWRMVSGNVVYTIAGARLLAQAISAAGNEEGAAALLAAVNKIEAAALRPVPAPVAKPDKSDWRKRADLQ